MLKEPKGIMECETKAMIMSKESNKHKHDTTNSRELDEGASGLIDVPEISVVIPVFKAEDCIDELLERLRNVLEGITPHYELVLVEDCGGDGSWALINQHAKFDSRIRGIQFSRNFGQHYGITAGLHFCRGNWVVVMDCDLQDRPEEIPRLYKKALEGYDVVIARRGKRKDPFMKRFISGLFYKAFSYLSEMEYDAEEGNYRIISRKVVINLGDMNEQLRFFGGLMSWMGFPTASISVQHDERFAGETSYTFRKLWKLASETIIAYSDKPLRLAINLGFLVSLLSFISGGYIFYRALFYDTPITGWSSLIVSLYFLGGIIISILGVLGVYLGKAFDETKKRPLYIVNETTFEYER